MGLAERATGGLHAHVLGRLTDRFTDRKLRILDVGCGTGALLGRLYALGYENLIGVDIAPPITLPHIKFLVADLDDFKASMEAGSIDLAIAVEVMEHVENVGSFLNELRRLLGPAGLILLTTPNVHSVEARLRFLLKGDLKQFDAIGDPTHVTPLFRFTFERILDRHGLTIVDSWGFPENGSSPTSRVSLRALAAIARAVGVKGTPDGDQLCMLIGKSEGPVLAGDLDRKRAELIAHYAV